MKELVENLNVRVKVAEEANNPVILTVDEAKQIIEALEVNTEGENWETLHSWSISKIGRLCPDISNKGWLIIHLALLCKQCYDLGIKSINSEQ